MAWFTYECLEHGRFTASLPKREKKYKCPVCQVEGGAIIKGGDTMQVLERLDNGAMARAVERLVDIEQIMEERSDKHSNFPSED
jgi:hypothetical protein